MDDLLDAALGASASSPHVQFAAFVLIGLAVGWVLVCARPLRLRALSPAVAIMGVCGAWLGSEAACLLGQVPRGGGVALAGGLIGAAALCYAWRRRHPERPDGPDHIALGRFSA
ncbi:hypothetical protein [Methylocystis echinoides]|jgi:hypothetical protein|uniref:hypothetical protein n=1 Tax=Methylocystis echinoides TaxID=29468 RepID=UPI003429B51A